MSRSYQTLNVLCDGYIMCPEWMWMNSIKSNIFDTLPTHKKEIKNAIQHERLLKNELWSFSTRLSLFRLSLPSLLVDSLWTHPRSEQWEIVEHLLGQRCDRENKASFTQAGLVKARLFVHLVGNKWFKPKLGLPSKQLTWKETVRVEKIFLGNY